MSFIKYAAILALTGATTGAFGLSPLLSQEQEYGRVLYQRTLRLNPDSLLEAHSDPAVYERSISAEQGTDSTYSQEAQKWFYIDREEFYRRVATQTHSEIFDYLTATYHGYFYHLPKERKLKEVEWMEQAAKRYNSDALGYEAAHLSVWFNNYEGKETEVWIGELEDAIHQMERRGATYWALRMKYHLFSQTAGFGTSYPVAFAMAEELIKELDEVSNTDFPHKRKVYSEIADLYYRFRDYQTAVPLLEKITAEPGAGYFDNSGLRARNTLGLYYQGIGQRNRAGDYFLSVLESRDTISMRSVHDAIALSNLGDNLAEAGLYREAIGLYRAALPVMIRETDYSFASGIAVGLAECFMELGDWNRAKQWADTALSYIREHIHYTDPHRAREIYPILAKYYTIQGDKATASQYIDSLSQAHADYRDEFNSMLLMRTRQELLAEKNKAQEEKLHAQRVRILGLVGITLATILALLIIWRLYRRKKAAYEKLSEQATRWAYAETVETLPATRVSKEARAHPSPDENSLVMKLHAIMSDGRRYTDPSLTLDSLAKEVGVNRNVLSGAINTVAGRNFNNFVNEYRVKEAVRVLSAPNNNIYIDEIYEQVGFNSRTSFYRAFKSFTGLSPTEYKRQIDQKESGS